MFWGQLLTVLLSIFFLWILIRFFRSHPGAFSKENWSKSFFTMGVLAVLLIGVIALAVFWLRA